MLLYVYFRIITNYITILHTEIVFESDEQVMC